MVIVTGANGFIGSVLVWEFNQRSIPVQCTVDLVSRKERPHLLETKKFDTFLLKDEIWDYLKSLSSKHSIQWVLHMGANSSTTETNADLLWEMNTFYTQKLWEWCTQNHVGFIYASSAATYGSGEMGFDDTTDSELLKPLNLYGESKVLFDRWAIKQTKTPPNWYGLKFFNVYGPNEYHKGDQASVPFKSFSQIRSQGEIKLFKSYKSEFGDGDQKRDFVYVKDISHWICELMEKKPDSGIYNMGFGEARSWNDLAKAGFSALKVPANIKYIEMPGNLKNQYQYYTKANMNKFFRAKMSPPKWSLEEGVKDYYQNYLGKDNSYL
jgi:ADP-L-glycero-D-manno-heptose 6-epimerase